MKHLIQCNHLALPFVLFFACNGNYQNHEESTQENKCAQLAHGQKGFIQLVNKDEPGEPLIIYGKIVDRKINLPVNAVSIFLYQTDSSGIYSSSGIDEQARLRGTVHTNESGSFK